MRSFDGELEQSRTSNLEGSVGFSSELNVARLVSLTETICQLDKTLFKLITTMEEENDTNYD